MGTVKLLASAGLLAVSISSAAFADISPWLIRARAIGVVPSYSGGDISTIGGKVSSISSTIVPELDISYFFNKNLSTELILGTSRHKVNASGTALGDVDLGRVSLLPPTLTLQYHFLADNNIRPYFGAGINYTWFYNIDKGPTASKITYSNSFGPVLQAGLDVDLNKNWSVNFDVKKVFIRTSAAVTAAGTTVNANVKIDPTIYGVGIGYRFS